MDFNVKTTLKTLKNGIAYSQKIDKRFEAYHKEYLPILATSNMLRELSADENALAVFMGHSIMYHMARTA